MSKKALFDSGKVIVYTDGGARGNPGPSAIGVVIENPAKSLLSDHGAQYGEYIGEKTNNQAEYEAVIFALKKLKALVGKKKTKETEVEVRMDSELVVRQLGGIYKIEEPNLKPLFVDVWNLKMDFKKIEFVHIPREKNKAADRMVNRVLDERG